MKLITISGLDGSGKSTQINLLKNYLESQGKKVFYFHAVNFSIGRLGKGTVSTMSNRSVEKANWFQIQLRKIALIIDIWRFEKLRNKLRNSGYDYILSDRYFYDSVVNIEYLSLKRDLVPIWGLSPLESLKPDISIYLQVSPETIMSRDRVPDQGLEYLKKKKELYDGKISEWNMKVVDGNQEKEKILKDLVSFLNL